MIHTVLLDRATPQPWRNGGGSTRELLAWPSVVDWQCRISVAEIRQDGPFSAFPGVERWFAVLRGAGVLLRFAAQRQMLTPQSEPFHFNGAAAPGCELLDGATQDLNLMTRSDAGHGAMRRAAAAEEWRSPAPLRAMFCHGAARLQIDDTDAAMLPAAGLAWGAHAAQQRWRVLDLAEGAGAWWLCFQPAST